MLSTPIAESGLLWPWGVYAPQFSMAFRWNRIWPAAEEEVHGNEDMVKTTRGDGSHGTQSFKPIELIEKWICLEEDTMDTEYWPA